jgi:hypothetical protein
MRIDASLEKSSLSAVVITPLELDHRQRYAGVLSCDAANTAIVVHGPQRLDELTAVSQRL